MDDFIIEVKQMSIEELELSIDTLKDAYSKEEYDIIKREYELRTKNIKDDTSVMIYCMKCDGANELGNELCKYCNEPLKKFNVNNPNEVKENSSSSGGYLISILLPFVGIVMGLIYISRKEDSYGKSLIITSITASIIYSILIALLSIL